MTNEVKSTEADRNFAAFQKMLPELLIAQPGKFVLMHEEKLEGYFDTLGDAARIGKEKFGDKFSIQEITSRDITLGFYSSYAMHNLPN